MGLFNRFLAKRQTKQPTDTPYIRGVYSYTAKQHVNEDTAMMVSAYHRGVMYISTQIAKLPIYIKREDNTIVNNRLSYLISRKPNSEMHSMKFRLLAIMTAINRGNFYAEIERNALDQIVALHPLNSSLVEGVRTPDGDLLYKVLGGGINNFDVYLRPREVFHLSNLHLASDGIFGQSLIAYAKTVLGASIGADGFASNFFANGGTPSGVLKVPGTLSDAAFKRLKLEWEEQHSGKKTGSTAILEEGTDYSPVSLAPDVMQFLETRKFNVIDIARFLGLPPAKLFDTDVATYANMEQAGLEVQTDTLDAWARNFEAEVEFKLLDNKPLICEMDLYAISRGDMNARSTYFQKMIQIGAITPNEIRMREGLAPYEGGDRFYIATNNFTPHDRMDEVIDSQVNKDTEPTGQIDNDMENEDKELTEAVTNYFKSKIG